MDNIKNEPVLVQSLVQVILGLFLAFGVDLTSEQVGTVMAGTAVILAVIARLFVTPNAKSSTPSAPPVDPPVV